MRPRNTREREVMALSGRIIDLSDAQKRRIALEIMERRIYTSGLPRAVLQSRVLFNYFNC